MDYKVAFDSFIGRRKENQDVVLFQQIAEDILLVGVADGMGGTQAGDVASALASEAIKEYVQSLEIEEFHESTLKSTLEGCYEVANFFLSEAIEKNNELRGMGTTLCLLLIFKDKYVWSNIGDSRIYKVQNDEIGQITKDHTYVEELAGTSEEEVPEEVRKKYQHMLTRSVDGRGETPDIFPVDKDFEELNPETYFLLCSDGLILDKGVNDNESFKEVLLQDISLQSKVRDLIQQAFEAGSNDNIAVGVVGISDEGNKKSTIWVEPENLVEKEQKTNRNILIASLIILLGIAFMLLYYGMEGSWSSFNEMEGNPVFANSYFVGLKSVFFG